MLVSDDPLPFIALILSSWFYKVVTFVLRVRVFQSINNSPTRELLAS